MKLVILLLAYMLRRRLDNHDRWNGDAAWRRWFGRGVSVEAGREDAIGRGLMAILVPVLLLILIAWLVRGAGLGILLAPLDLVVLVALMGAPGWRQVLNDYADAWARGDTQAAWHHIQERLPASERGAALSPEAMHLALSRALMTSVFNRYFLVVFWYLLGGLPLALLARGLVALADHWPAAPARERYRQAAQWLAWIPARLLSCTFGVAGDFAGWSRDIRRVLPGFGRSTDDVLITAANGSLTGYALDPARFSEVHPEQWPDFGGRSLAAVRDLLNRSMLVWICVIALLVIAGVA